jgi:hypothetical protein
MPPPSPRLRRDRPKRTGFIFRQARWYEFAMGKVNAKAVIRLVSQQLQLLSTATLAA